MLRIHVLGAVALVLPMAGSIAPRPVAASPVVGAPACPILPADDVWHADISGLPVAARSGQWIASMGGTAQHIHPDLGPTGTATPYGIPYTVVGSDHLPPPVPVAFRYAGESDPGPYPLGPDTLIENGSDRHALIVDRDACRLYELFNTHYSASGSTADSGAIFDLRSNALRPSGWTSADAAGLPILPGLLRLDEVQAGAVDHAIRMTAARTDTSFLWPARHQAGTASDPALPPMGARFRLRAGVDLSGFSPTAQVVLRGMQRYGLILADNGSNWYFTGSADSGWADAVLTELKSVPAGDFDAVDESSLQVSANSGQAAGGVASRVTAGYWLVAADGGVFPFGLAQGLGSMGGVALNRPVVGMARTPSGRGYWLVASDGGVFPFGDARGYGSTGGIRLNRPIVGMAPTRGGGGYWLVAADGGIFPFGDATGHGSTGAIRLNQPVVGMALTASGAGYWLVAADGGIFPFGDAVGHGSTGAIRLNRAMVGMASTASGAGYWLVAADGGIFPFGDAVGYGSTGAIRLNRPIVGMAATSAGSGYWLVASDGGVFPFGLSAPGLGSLGGTHLAAPVVGMAS